MKLLFFVVIFSACLSLSAQQMRELRQPGAAVRTTTAQFAGTDSTYKTQTEYGTEVLAKGFMVAPGVADSVIIILHPNGNSANTRFPYKIRASDVGVPIPFLFTKIFRTGTTCPLDSIWVFPNL